MPENRFCHLCGCRIYGDCYAFHHKEWSTEKALCVCADCLKNKPRCKVCTLPIAFPSPNGLCNTCNSSLKYCLVCGDAVGKKHFEFDFRKPYCSKCVEIKKPCDHCGAPLTKESWQISDDRRICAYCHSMAVFAPEQAQRKFLEIKMAAAEQLKIELNIPTGLILLNRHQLSEMIGSQFNARQSDHSNAHRLDPARTLGLYVRRGIRRVIYVQTGLPQIVFAQVAAHELGHAWQKENCPLSKDDLVNEGFAEWVSYHILGYFGYRSEQKRMRDRQDIYGEGLAWALAIEEKQGATGVVEACRHSI